MRSRRFPSRVALPGALLALGASPAWAQCPPGYAASATAPSFTSIVGAPGAVTVFTAPNDDGLTTAIPMPFPFSFFGAPVANFRISANGFVDFDQAATGAFFTNAAIPSVSSPNNYATGWWDDLYHLSGTAQTAYQVSGSAPNRKLAIEWRDLEHWPGNSSGENVHFQLVLDETSNSIEYHYNGATFVGGPWSATIGIEDSTGTSGLDVTGGGATNAFLPATDYSINFGAAAPTTTFLGGYAVAPFPFGFTSIAPPGPGTPVPYITPPIGCTNWCPGVVDDDGTTPIPIGFNFVYFGQTKTEFRVNANGFLWFDMVPTPCGYFGNAAVPSPAAPNDAIFGYWDDLSHSILAPGPPTTYEALVGTPGSQQRIVEWSGVTPFSGACAFPGSQFYFQVALLEGTNQIEFRYNPTVGVGGTVSGTVGFEDSTGTIGTDVTGFGGGNPGPPQTTNYRATPSATCTVGGTRFGTACATSTGSVPSICQIGGPPVAGNAAFAVGLFGGVPSSAAVLILGFSNTISIFGPLPLSLGFLGIPQCTLYASPDSFFATSTNASGGASVALPVPAAFLNCVGSIWFQWIFVDPGAGPPLPIRLSDAMREDL